MAEQSFPITIPCTSPLWNYSPQFDVDIGTGWATQYSGGTEEFAQGFVYGYGTATRATRANGASFSLDFYGSGVTLRGSSNSVSYEVTLDGQKFSGNANGAVLATFSGLETKAHSISVQVYPSGSAQFSLERADVIVGTGLTGATITSTTYDPSSDSIRYYDMVKNYEELLQNKNRPNYIQGNQRGDYVRLTFKGTAVSIFGMCNDENGNYQVTLDGNDRILSAKAAHWQLDTLMFHQAGLDPSSEHTIQYMNVEQGKEFDFISFVTLAISGGTKVTTGGTGGGGGGGGTSDGGQGNTNNGPSGTTTIDGSTSQLPSGVSSLPPGSSDTSLPFFGPSYADSNDPSRTDSGISPSGSVAGGTNSGSGSGPGSGGALDSGSQTPTAAIVLGAVLGAVVLAVLLGLFFFLGRRRERRRLKELRALEPIPPPATTTTPPQTSEANNSSAALIASDQPRGKAALAAEWETQSTTSPTSASNSSQRGSTFPMSNLTTHPVDSSRDRESITSPFSFSLSPSLPPRFTFSSRAVSPPPEYAPREEQ